MILFPAKNSTTLDNLSPRPESEIDPTISPAKPVATATVTIFFAAATIAQKISVNPCKKSAFSSSYP